MSGSDLLRRYTELAPSDDAGRLSFQEQSFQALFAALGEREWTAVQVADFVAQFPQLEADQVRLAALEDYAQDAPPIKDAVLSWSTLPSGSAVP